MIGGARVAARPRTIAGPRAWLLMGGLWLAAAAISAFTIRRHLDPFDEGLLLAAVDRIIAGQWLYGDFAWAYGPGHPLLLALVAKAFGPSVLWWRLVRVAADATVAVIAFALVRPSAGARWGVAAWLACAVTMAQPSLANPLPIALALALAGLLAAASGRPVLAGVLVAATTAWRLDFGAVAGLAALVAAGDRVEPAGARIRDRPRLGPRGRLVAAAACGTALVYAPFAIAAGPGELWQALAGGSLDDARAWRLPFPLIYDGPLRAWPPGDMLRDAKDLIGYQVPLVAVLGLAVGVTAVAVRAVRDGRLDRVAAGLARARARRPGVSALARRRVPPAAARRRGRGARWRARSPRPGPVARAWYWRRRSPSWCSPGRRTGSRRSCCRRICARWTCPGCPASASRRPRRRRCREWSPPCSG